MKQPNPEAIAFIFWRLFHDFIGIHFPGEPGSDWESYEQFYDWIQSLSRLAELELEKRIFLREKGFELPRDKDDNQGIEKTLRSWKDEQEFTSLLAGMGRWRKALKGLELVVGPRDTRKGIWGTLWGLD